MHLERTKVQVVRKLKLTGTLVQVRVISESIIRVHRVTTEIGIADSYQISYTTSSSKEATNSIVSHNVKRS